MLVRCVRPSTSLTRRLVHRQRGPDTLSSTFVALLVYSAPGQPERQFELGPRTTVGRHPACDIQILDSQVSKGHFEILARDGNHYIRDLGTTNGTWVNGVRLLGDRRLDHLDEISAARVRFLFLDPEGALRRSPTGGPYRRAAPGPPPPAPAPAAAPARQAAFDVPALRRFYALVRMLSAEGNRKQLAADAASGLLSLCEADWAVLLARRDEGGFEELARAGRDKPPDVAPPYPALLDLATSARAPTFQLGQDHMLQLAVPLVHAGEARGVFWVGMPSSIEIAPVMEVLGTYSTFVAVALTALRER